MDVDKIQDFLLHHFEKMILVVVVAASGFLVYQGLQQKNILEVHQPDRLIADARQVRAEVDDDRNKAILEDRIPDFDINKEIDRRRSPVEPGPYAVKPWEPMNVASNIRREDPVLLAPRALQVHGVLAPMAMRSSDGMYALKDLEPADPIEVEAEPEKKPSRSRSRRSRGGGGYGEEGMEGMEEMYEEMFSESDDMEMEMGYPGIGGESMAGGTGVVRRLENPLGMRPTTTTHIINDAKQPPVPGIGWFIAGTAVMPYKALFDSYKDALALADDYNPGRRDRPIFTSYELQRADVTDKSVAQLQEADWVKRDGRTECIKDAVLYWSGFAPEIVPKDYREDTKLTMWIPPVMLTDYSTFALHPMIPMLSKRELEAAAAKEARQSVPVEVDAEDIVVGDAAMSTDYESSYEMDDMSMEGGGMAASGYGSMGQVEKNPPEYKLIRFYDFAVDRQKDPNAPKPGRQYVYRLRVGIEDPNFPKNPALQPQGSRLAPDAYVRVMKKVSAVESAKDPVAARKIESQRWTEWSQPSEPVSLPGRDKVYVGPVLERKSRQVKVGERLVPYEADPPKANLVISQFSPVYSSRLSILMKEITEGAVLSNKAEFADIVDPITLEVKKAPDAQIISDVTVIDIEGGDPLGIHEAEGFVAPSQMLIFDSNGGLQVHDEVDDLEFYRIDSFAEERGK